MKGGATISVPERAMPPRASGGVAAQLPVIDELLIATINRPEGDTGIHAHTRSLVAGMTRAAVQCEVISAFSGTPVWLAIFAVRPLLLNRVNKTWSTRWHRYWHGLALERNLLARLRQHQPKAIIAQCPVSALAALNARQKLTLDIPIIAVCHFNFSEATEYRDKGELRGDAAFKAVTGLEVDVLSRVDEVVYVSQWARNMVESERGIAPRSSAVIWNGIADEEAAKPVDRTVLGLSNQDVVLINVGSLEARKNQIGLLDQFSLIAKQFPSTQLLLVGDGPDRAAVEKKIASLCLQERVKLLGFRSDVPSLLATSDLYLHYAKLENCPVVLLEASRAGIPSATVPAGGAAEILEALGAGVLLNPDDLDASARALAPMLADSNVRQEMGERARAGFENRFTQSAMVQAYLQAIRSVRVEIGEVR